MLGRRIWGLGLFVINIMVIRLLSSTPALGRRLQDVDVLLTDDEWFGLRQEVKSAKAKAASDMERRMWDAAVEGEADLGKRDTWWQSSEPDQFAWNQPAPRKSVHNLSTKNVQSEKDVALKKIAELQGYEQAEASTIYVSNIPSTVSEDSLRRWFETYGSIEHVHFPIVQRGRRWLGHCRIQFSSPSVAQDIAAKQVYDQNNVRLVIRSCVFGRDEKPYHLGRPGSTIFVNGFDRMTTQKELRKVFERFGPVVYAHIPLNEEGYNLHYAFVSFFEEGVGRAVMDAEQTAPFVVRGKRVELELRELEVPRRTPTSSLFISGLHRDVTQEDVLNLFKDISEISSCHLHAAPRRNRLLTSQAYVNFPSFAAAQKVLDMHHLLPFEFRGYELLLNFCSPTVDVRSPRTPNSTLYIGRLDRICTVGEIKETFRDFATDIKALHMNRNPDGQCSGGAFLKLRSVEAATTILEQHRREPFEIKDEAVEITYARHADETVPTRDLRLTPIEDGLRGLQTYLSEYSKHITRMSVVNKEPFGHVGHVRFRNVIWAMRAKERMALKPLRSGTIPEIRFGSSVRPWLDPLTIRPGSATISPEELSEQLSVRSLPVDGLLDEIARKDKIFDVVLNSPRRQSQATQKHRSHNDD
ncbi:hypothetical protein EUX98_g9602 [Antrodiella citrinella]|uniref:RRM domain-containing protein n=1 Tax=Antrodiella citrinella TaxID=2447956 RepID=A0A4S4LQF8_9APHY|nr:hypothetical protein EUX98_g9602 [Antrodiella citrinella]